MQCADKMWVIHEGKILEGAPEDLGMSGLFNELFSTSGISFNEQAGRFLFSGKQRGHVSLEGEEEKSLIWTRNTLKRLGFKLDKGAGKLIKIESSKDGYSWVLQKNSGPKRFENLYTLARFLIQEE